VSEYRVRSIEPRDAGPVAALHAALFNPGWSEAAVAGLIAAPTTRGLVATDPAGPITAFVLAQAVLDEAEILSIGTAVPVQSRGLGRLLLGQLLDDLARGGVARVHLEVAAGNTTALRLYRRLGFSETGRRSGYYGSQPDGDAVMMARTFEVRSPIGSIAPGPCPVV
jgi:[ribosomal protein S18]-alanine N-acetyltransferase